MDSEASSISEADDAEKIDPKPRHGRKDRSNVAEKSGANGRPRAADFMTDSEDDFESHDKEESVVSDQESDAPSVIGSEADSEEHDMSEVDEGKTVMDDERRAKLRQIMGEEHKNVAATISEAARADVNKGNAVKQQRKTFDSLLGIRMQLQKALIAMNTTQAIIGEDRDETEQQSAYKAAEDAAIKLWNNLDGLRQDLESSSADAKVGHKRKRDIDSSTSSADIWARMQAREQANLSTRHAILDKWSAKVKASKAQPVSRKLNPTSKEQSLTDVLQDYLLTSDHLIQRTQIPRSCAPQQAASVSKAQHDPSIYDDADWYQLLLQEFIAQKKGSNAIDIPMLAQQADKPMWSTMKEAKTKRNVDTKASKGRKLRYNVHEKLQNFMASEDRRSWEVTAIDRLFSSLLGREMVLDEDQSIHSEDDDDAAANEDGLRLFRS